MNSEQKLSEEYYYKQEKHERAFQNAIRFPFKYKPEQFMRPEERLSEPFTAAAPKSKGEFSKGIMKWAQSYGFDYDSPNTRKLYYTNNNGSRLFLERSSDILWYLSGGIVDYGILGAEKVLERQSDWWTGIPIQPLCFGNAILCLGFKDDNYPQFSSVDDLTKYIELQSSKGKKIATSLPKTTDIALQAIRKKYYTYGARYFTKGGSIENSIDLMPDNIFAIADIVESGETSFANNIRADYRLLEIPGAFVVKFDFVKQKEIQDFIDERS